MQLIHCNLDAMIEDVYYFAREWCMCRDGVLFIKICHGNVKIFSRDTIRTIVTKACFFLWRIISATRAGVRILSDFFQNDSSFWFGETYISNTGRHWCTQLNLGTKIRNAIPRKESCRLSECYNVGSLLTECSWIPNVVSQCSCYGFIHDNAVIMSMIAPHQSLLSHLFRRRSNKTSKLRVTGLCVGNSPGTG